MQNIPKITCNACWHIEHPSAPIVDSAVKCAMCGCYVSPDFLHTCRDKRGICESCNYDNGDEMSNRELLELAAKAAGLIEPGWVELRESGEWNPLTDDGDALRLVVTLTAKGLWDAAEMKNKSIDGWDIDPYAATRRAIVRAAAEIGRRMRSIPKTEV